MARTYRQATTVHETLNNGPVKYRTDGKPYKKPDVVVDPPEPQPLAVPGETWNQKQIDGYLAAWRAKSKGERRGLRLQPPLLVTGPDGMFDLNQGEYVDVMD